MFSNFTPSELKYVAETTLSDDHEIWVEDFANKQHVVCEKVYSTYTKGEFYNPETNDKQFRALVAAVYPDINAEAMIAAVQDAYDKREGV